jgi:hypothetical protein
LWRGFARHKPGGNLYDDGGDLEALLFTPRFEAPPLNLTRYGRNPGVSGYDTGG